MEFHFAPPSSPNGSRINHQSVPAIIIRRLVVENFEVVACRITEYPPPPQEDSVDDLITGSG